MVSECLRKHDKLIRMVFASVGYLVILNGWILKLKEDNSDCENKFNNGHLQNGLVSKIVFYSFILE